MQHDIKLETYPFIGPLFINKKESTEHILQNNHKHGSITKDLNRNIDTSISGPSKYTLVRHKPKVNLVRFFDPYDHINPMDNTNDETHLVDTNE